MSYRRTELLVQAVDTDQPETVERLKITLMSLNGIKSVNIRHWPAADAAPTIEGAVEVEYDPSITNPILMEDKLQTAGFDVLMAREEEEISAATENAELIDDWVTTLNRGDWDELKTFYSYEATFVGFGPDRPIVGRDALITAFREHYEPSSLEVLVDNLVATDDFVVLEGNETWVEPGGSKRLKMPIAYFFDVLEGAIVRQRTYCDPNKILELDL